MPPQQVMNGWLEPGQGLYLGQSAQSTVRFFGVTARFRWGPRNGATRVRPDG
jgi:hypothetical protein